MLNASEAKERTQNNINELNEIEKQINDAVLDGRFVINGGGKLQSVTIEKLRGLGYDVTTSTQGDNTIWRIAWC